MEKRLVLKFGGASLKSTSSFDQIADLIIEYRKEYSQLIVVVSAMQSWTDQLLSMSLEVHPNPPRREQDMLISCGERMSMALLAMALDKKNIHAVSLTGSQSGIITDNKHANARILDVKPGRIQTHLSCGDIVIIAGFQGVSLEKEVTTLGRGGSDTTAVALATALSAEGVVFFKDVPGMFLEDPKKKIDQKPFSHLNYNEALAIVQKGAKILHERSVILAEKNNIPLFIRSFELDGTLGTCIKGECARDFGLKIYEGD